MCLHCRGRTDGCGSEGDANNHVSDYDNWMDNGSLYELGNKSRGDLE